MKQLCHFESCQLFLVAPFTGAWIETALRYCSSVIIRVAPFTGAWIETYGL